MSSCLPPFGFLFKAALPSLLAASCATAAAADVGRPMSNPRGTRVTTTAQGRWFGVSRPLQSGANWVIRDLGLPAQIRGAPPTTLIPTPHAINQHGDVALTVCPAGGCGNVQPPSIANAYLYDYHCARLIPLAKLPRQSNPPPVEQYVPQALNDRGQIVGAVIRSVGQNTVSWPVIWTRRGFGGSTIARLDSTPGDQGSAYGINNFGVTVGSVYTGPYMPNGFGAGNAVRFTGGAPVLLGANPSLADSDAFGINDNGVAVGDVGGTAAVFTGGVAVAIAQQFQCPRPYDVCDGNAAVAINKAGDVLGNFITNYFDMADQSFVGFLWANKTFTTLAPTCFSTNCPIQYQQGDNDHVVALNDSEDFVGNFVGQPWVSFSPTSDANGLLPPKSGWQIISVAAINDRRQIVGQGYHAGYGKAIRAFLLEPPR